ILMAHPLLAPFWLAGLGWFFAGARRRYRFLGLTFVVFYVLMVAFKAKNYYLAPFYPILAAGAGAGVAAVLERWRVARGAAWPRLVVAGYVTAAGMLVAPIVLPLLSPERYLTYEKAIGASRTPTEVAHQGPLPQEW